MPTKKYREKRKENIDNNLFKKLIKKIRIYLPTRINVK